jgi:Sulfate permease family
MWRGYNALLPITKFTNCLEIVHYSNSGGSTTLISIKMQNETLKFEDNSMKNPLKVTRFQFDPLPVQYKSNLTKGLTAVAVILPQALAFAAASGIEAKGELYTTVVAGTFLTALAIVRCLQGTYLNKNFKEYNSVKSMRVGELS